MGVATRLSESERREIAGGLFAVDSEDQRRGELIGLCPIHEEKNPSFAYSYKKDVFVCSSCQATGDLAKLWQDVRGGTFADFCREHGLSNDVTGGHAGDRLPVPEDLESIWAMFPPLPTAWVQRLAETRGWTSEAIKSLDLRLQTHYWHKKSGKLRSVPTQKIAIPVRDTSGRLLNIRCYLPGASQFKICSWGKGFGSARLFPPVPLWDDVPIVLCEGEPDTICAVSHGLNSITQTGKLKKWPAEQLAPFRGRDVYIAYDADKPGRKYALAAAKALSGVAGLVRIIEWPADIMPVENDHGQDLTDFFVKHGGSVDAFWDLAEAAADYQPVFDKVNAAVDAGEDPAAIDDGAMAFFARGVNDRLSFKPRMLADRLAEENQLVFEPKSGVLYRWGGQIWEQHPEEHLKRRAIELLQDEANQSRVNDAAFQARILATISPDRDMNDRGDWVCLKSGMFHLETGEHIPHDPDFLATIQLNVDLSGDVPRCERWLEFLSTNIQTVEVIRQLQEFFGYCLTRHTKYEKALLCLGPGSDGKSVLLNVLRKLVGPENCSAISFDALNDQFQRAGLHQKLLNLSTEVGAGVIESPYFKSIVSGDPISAAFKYRDSFPFIPFCKLAFSANHLPRVLDNSDGFFRRILPVRFKRQFIQGDDADPGLPGQLEAELSGIFKWAVVGLRRLEANGHFTRSPETDDILLDYRRANSPVVCFVEDECQIGAGREVYKDDLYDRYDGYCTKSGFRRQNKETFFRDLYLAISHLSQTRRRTEHGRVNIVQGISLVS